MSSDVDRDDLDSAGGAGATAAVSASDTLVPTGSPPVKVGAPGVPGSLRYTRASDMVGLDVVSLEGNRAVEVKDIVFDKEAGGLTGFTLRKPGLLGGPQKSVLPIAGVHAVGPDAVMITSYTVLTDAAQLAASGDNVLGDRVITDDGTELGTVVDVVVSVEVGTADLVGFEIEASATVDPQRRRLFVPLPAVMAISGEAVVVPAGAADHLSPDIEGLHAAVRALRQQGQEQSP